MNAFTPDRLITGINRYDLLAAYSRRSLAISWLIGFGELVYFGSERKTQQRPKYLTSRDPMLPLRPWEDYKRDLFVPGI